MAARLGIGMRAIFSYGADAMCCVSSLITHKQDWGVSETLAGQTYGDAADLTNDFIVVEGRTRDEKLPASRTWAKPKNGGGSLCVWS